MHKQPKRSQVVLAQDWQGEIERLGWGGKGIGRLDDGRIVLLDSALAMFPGEVVAAQIRLKAKHAEGELTRLVTCDPARVEPSCDVAQSCGACQLWGSGKKNSELKRLMVNDLLHRQLPDAPEYSWYCAPAETKRSRIQLHWDGASLGFHAKRSNTIVAVDICPMAVDLLSAAINPLRNALATGDLPTTPDRWELATGTPPGLVVATTKSAAGKAWELAGDTWVGYTGPLIHQLGGNEIRQMPGAFFQACPQWAWEAFSKVLTGWDIRGNTLYDLYGGSGFFSLMLAGRFNSITLVESADLSVAAAQGNLAGLKDRGCEVRIVCAQVEDWLPGALGTANDVILLDPPRSGLPKLVANRLNSAAAKAIVLVGCDGMVFCRDVMRLDEKWHLENLAVADLFPNTVLAEFVGLLLPNH